MRVFAGSCALQVESVMYFQTNRLHCWWPFNSFREKMSTFTRMLRADYFCFFGLGQKCENFKKQKMKNIIILRKILQNWSEIGFVKGIFWPTITSCGKIFAQYLLFRCASISWIHVGEWVSQSLSHSCFWDFFKSWAYLQAIFRVCSGYVQ